MKRFLMIGILILLSINFSGCNEVKDEDEDNSISFSTLIKGYIGPNESGYYIFYNQSSFESHYASLTDISKSPFHGNVNGTIPDIEQINFDKEMVISICLGLKFTTIDTIFITDIIETNENLEVYVLIDEPRPDTIIAGSPRFYPIHMIKLQRIEKDVLFIISNTEYVIKYIE